MVQPGTYNIKLQRRADYSLPLQLKGSDKNPLNLTGWTAVAQAWDQARTTKHADFAITYVDRTLGKLTLSLDSTQTASLPRECQYDLMLINPSGQRYYYLEGTLQAEEGYSAP